MLLFFVYDAGADWINLTGAQSAPNIAEFHVNDDHVRVVLEIYVGDVDKFVDLLPDEWIRQAGVEPPPIEERMRRFSAETLQIVANINDQEAVVILENLLKNIYRSFDFREESDVYDRLATSVSGDLLTNIYLQNRKSLIITQAGGAQAKVKEIEIQDVSVKHLDDRPLALLFHSKWTAMGTVGHWGHIHTRKNQYEANITVEPVDGAWKVTDLELLEEKRIDPYAKPKA
ncbi:MAG: hypothetical protein JSV38_15050 [Desulfobacterales bacterium]|nr:MAG: hypothetical protein JSV38_15050 [Desulfobacterales bacterium]